jgi:hypothetical protein
MFHLYLRHDFYNVILKMKQIMYSLRVISPNGKFWVAHLHHMALTGLCHGVGVCLLCGTDIYIYIYTHMYLELILSLEGDAYCNEYQILSYFFHPPPFSSSS